MKALRENTTTIVLLVIAAAVGLTTLGYVLTHQEARPRFPWEATPMKIAADVMDANGVTAGQGQSVRVAGVQVGLVTKVRLHDGMARISMDIRPRYRTLIRRNSTALLRPRSLLKDMFVEIDPGDASQPPMHSGDVIPVARTQPDVNADQILESLDGDSRDYLRLLINGAGKGLHGRGADLREVFRQFVPLNRDLLRVSRAFSGNHRALARVVDNYRILTEELARKDTRLTAFVHQSNRFLAATADRSQQIRDAVPLLAPAFDETRTALDDLATLGRVAGPSMDSLLPALRASGRANRSSIAVAKLGAGGLRRQVRPFVRALTPYLRTASPGTRKLAQATPDLTGGVHGLNRLLNLFAYNKAGDAKPTGDPAEDRAQDKGFLYWLAWGFQLTNSMESVADGQGVMRRIVALASCDNARALVANSPALAPILGIGTLVNDPSVCTRP